MSTIRLAGKDYEVPTLTIKEIRQLDWRIISASVALFDRAKLTQKIADEFFDIAFIAIHKVNPEITREQFDAMDVTLVECMKAMPVIAKQTNIFSVSENPQPGESTPSIGTA